MTILSQPFVFAALEAQRAGNNFPIDFDDVWDAIGYSRKNNAKRTLFNTDFVESQDYIVTHTNVVNSTHQGLLGGRPIEKIFLSIDAFKIFCLMAHTTQGREVRHYFIELERAYIAQLERLFAQSDAQTTVQSELLNQFNVQSELIAHLEEKVKHLENTPRIIFHDPRAGRCKFTYTSRELQKVVNYCDHTMLLRAIRNQGVLWQDYTKVRSYYWLTFKMFVLIVLNSRTKQGLNLKALPKGMDWLVELVYQLEPDLREVQNTLKQQY